MNNEGFGKKWIDRILGKVDKDQGVANAGKVLGIGADGQVTPVEQSGGSGEVLFEKITVPSSGYLYYNHNLYDQNNLYLQPLVVVLRISATRPKITINSIDEANSIIHANLENGSGGTYDNFVTMFGGYAEVYSSNNKTATIWGTGAYKLSISASTTIDTESGYLYIRGLSYTYIQRTNSNSIYYTIDKNSIIYIERSSDRKIFTVIVDNLYGFEKQLHANANLYTVYAPPNMLSTEPFPDA